MRSSSNKPIIVLLPGSFAKPILYEEVIRQLTSHGYETIGHTLVTVDAHEGPTPPTMADDAAHIRKTVSALAEKGRDVVLVSHSYSGMPVSESAKGLGKKEREAAGKSGGIVSLVYLTALMLSPGQTLGDGMAEAGGLQEWLIVEGDYMRMEQVGAGEACYSQLTDEDEKLKWGRRFGTHSAISFGSPLEYAAYYDIPTTYLLCENDKVIPIEVQRHFVEVANENSKVKIKTEVVDADHCPMVCRPDKVVEVLRRAAGEDI